MREEEVSVSFATDAPNADVSTDKDQLTITLTPPMAIDPMARPTVELSTLRFVNSYHNISEQLQNNKVQVAWMFNNVDNSSYLTTLTFPDGSYSLEEIQKTFNAKLTGAGGWPKSVYPTPISLTYIPTLNRVQMSTAVPLQNHAQDFFRIANKTAAVDVNFMRTLGFLESQFETVTNSLAFATPSILAAEPAQIDRVNGVRVDVDVATRSYAPPESNSNGQNRGHSDAIAFIPIQALPGHQQVYMPADAPQAGCHVGMTERITIRLRDQTGLPLKSDEHWSGMLTFRGLTPHAR